MPSRFEVEQALAGEAANQGDALVAAVRSCLAARAAPNDLDRVAALADARRHLDTRTVGSVEGHSYWRRPPRFPTRQKVVLAVAPFLYPDREHGWSSAGGNVGTRFRRLKPADVFSYRAATHG